MEVNVNGSTANVSAGSQWLSDTKADSAKKKEQQDTLQQKSDSAAEITISKESMESYRKEFREKGMQGESYESVLQRRENLKKMSKLVFANHYEGALAGETAKLKEQREGSAYRVSDKAEDYVRAYGKLYDEIVQGYENGTRELYVEDEASETGLRRLTMEEELSSLDKAYKKAADRETIFAENARRAAAAFKKTGEKLSKIKNGAGAAFLNAYQKQQEIADATQGNIGQKMEELAQAWKDAYQHSGSKESSMEKVLSMLKEMFTGNIPQ